eukprot:TRINITY_DN797_c7_g1_i1.p1 TRINITY_DN797_c7_g1~~TRINITY_DN797_c7_g1_i1.p1  ORF type:complete len:227 (+),score=22.58 TRINITY_DN797_c7_g1_i1:44-724(+)
MSKLHRILVFLSVLGVGLGAAPSPTNLYPVEMVFIGGSLAGFWDNWAAIEKVFTDELAAQSSVSCSGLCQFTRSIESQPWDFVVCHSCNGSSLARGAVFLEDIRYDMRLSVATTGTEDDLINILNTTAGPAIGALVSATYNSTNSGTIVTPMSPDSSDDDLPSPTQWIAVGLVFCMAMAASVFAISRMRSRSKQEKEFYDRQEEERDAGAFTDHYGGEVHEPDQYQ